MKKNILLFCFLPLCFLLQAQEKQVFTESFTDNHNNWAVIDKKGLKTSLSAEKYYDINNQSKNDFTSLVAVPLDSMKDLHITMAINNFKYSDDKGYGYTGYCNFIIGAKDENNGYNIFVGEKALHIYPLHENAYIRKSYQLEIENGTPEHLDMRIEHNRWKFYNLRGNEIANIPAMPLEGNKMGVIVYRPAHYALTSLTVSEKEKELTKIDFSLPLFMYAYRQLLCSADHLFKDDFGTPYKDSKNTWYSKTSVPGFGFYTYLIKDEKSIELISSRKVNSLDEAYAYYEEAIGGIKLTKDTCLEMANNTDLIAKEDFFKTHYVQFENWRTGFRDDHAEKVEGNVLVAISKVYNESAYLVEFHIVLYLSGKVF